MVYDGLHASIITKLPFLSDFILCWKRFFLDLRICVCYNRHLGRLAQWLERCVDIAEVTGPNPVSPMFGETVECKDE